MKRFFALLFGCMLVLAGLAGAQSGATAAPILTPSQKLELRDAQHAIDVIEKQQKQLALDVADVQRKVNAEDQRLTALHGDAQKALDAVLHKLQGLGDEKAWKLDVETMTFKAAPPVEQAKK